MIEANEMEKLPEGWKKVKLGEVAYINMGQSPPSNVVNEIEIGIPFLQGNAEFTGKYPIPQKWVTKPLKLSRKDDILISVRAPVGAINKANMDYCIGRGLAAISFKSIDGEFGWFGLIHWKHQLETLSQGSTFEAISKDDLKNLLLLIPASLSEQRKIAEILETVDNAIERTDTIIEKYKRIKQGLMQDLLTRGVVENDELGVMNYELRDEKKHRFKDSPLGRIPEEWEVVELGDVFKLKSGKTKPLDTADFGKYPVYGGNEILGFSNKYNFNEETIIIGRVGEYCGIVYVARKGWVTDNALYVVSKKRNYDNLFLFYSLRYVNLNKFSAETGQPLMTQSIIYKVQLPLPPLPEQHRIASVLSQMDETVEKEQEYKQKLESIKQGLMEDLLTGKVKVNYELGVRSYELGVIVR